MNRGEKAIAIIIPITVALIGGIFTLISDLSEDTSVLKNPTAIISGPRTVTANTMITFTADKSKDLDGFIDNYRWHVNGEIIGAQSFLNYTFGINGTYQIDLVVFDDDGLLGKDTIAVQVLKESPTDLVMSHLKQFPGSEESLTEMRTCV